MSDDDKPKRRDPHHALNNPARDPDPTEWPDPYEKRDDPRGPGAPEAGEGTPHPPVGSTSTSDPHPSQDPEARDKAEPPDSEELDG